MGPAQHRDLQRYDHAPAVRAPVRLRLLGRCQRAVRHAGGAASDQDGPRAGLPRLLPARQHPGARARALSHGQGFDVRRRQCSGRAGSARRQVDPQLLRRVLRHHRQSRRGRSGICPSLPGAGAMTERRALPLIAGLLPFYAALAGVAWLIDRWKPQWGAFFSDKGPGGAAIAMIGALALVCPVAWMYMRTKPKARYDSSLVQTVIVLPVVIAGVVLIVRDSVALAFSLAGIVAAVRFRNTLKDTKDAVYIFLAIAVGIAAGVQSFSIAFVVSIIFVLLVMVLWR